MPDIEEMNLQREIERYMKKYNEFDDYVFVSYSHKDWKVVYPVVLKWLQNGYNVHNIIMRIGLNRCRTI